MIYMDIGLTYLVQPAELVGTNRYKIGCSSKSNLDRCKNGYEIGTRYLHIMECVNPFILEKELKKIAMNIKKIATNVKKNMNYL